MAHVPPPDPPSRNSRGEDPANRSAPPPPAPGPGGAFSGTFEPAPPTAYPGAAPGDNFESPPPTAYPSAAPGPRFEPVPRIAPSVPASEAIAPGAEPPPPLGAPIFVSAATERPRPVTSGYDHARSRWGMGDMFASLGVYFASAIGLILFIVAAGTTNDDGLPQGPWLLVAVVGPHTMLLVHLFWVIRRKGVSFVEDFKLRVTWPDIGLAIGLFFGALITAGIVAFAITEITGEQPTAAATDLAQDSGEGGLTIWLVLFAILGATFVPVVEELVYRGLFWSALEKRGMKPWMILVITSAVFAMIHLEPIRTPVLFAVGMAIGIGRFLTGRIGAAIAVHVFINSLAMIATVAQIA